METRADEDQDGWGKLPKQLSTVPKALPTPWPQLDRMLTLSPPRLVVLGGRSRSREAEAGYGIAVHNAALGTPVLLLAPQLTPRNEVPNLLVDRTEDLTADLVEERIWGLTRRPQPIKLA